MALTQTEVTITTTAMIGISVYGTGNAYITATGPFKPFVHDDSRGFFNSDITPEAMDDLIAALMQARILMAARRAAWNTSHDIPVPEVDAA